VENFAKPRADLRIHKRMTKGELMKPRIDFKSIPADATKGMYLLEHFIHHSGLEESLVHLVKFRASQINGCAYCLDMHSKDALAIGETDQRLFVLDAWEEAPFYSDRERAALALTEAMTNISDGHVRDEVWDRAKSQFSEQELIALVVTITTINAWNRLAITTRTEVGGYQPQKRQAQTKTA
jgi:AhpD family alkylhydroperoxidase